MNIYKLMRSGLLLCSIALSSYAHDAITWETFSNGSKVTDTVSLGDYLP